MYRQEIGQGWEHTVYASNREGWVLKRPTKINAASMFILGYGADKVRDEISRAEEETKALSGVQVPDTRVIAFPMVRLGTHSFGRSYVIAQKYIAEDHSVPAIEEHLLQQGETTLLGRYQTAPDNFRTNGGRIHLIDPSHAFYRFGERLGFSYQRLVSIRSRLPWVDRLKELLLQKKNPPPKGRGFNVFLEDSK